MIQIDFSESDQQALNKGRYHHDHPRVRQRMEVLWFKSHGLAHGEIERLADVSSSTVTRYLKMYQQGGLAALQQLDFNRPESQLEPYREILRAHFEQHPPARVNQAIAEIKQLTGIELKREAVRVFLHHLGLSVRKMGMVPAKADPAVQEAFKKKELMPRLDEATAGKRAVFFVDAAHFVLAPFLGFLWCFSRLFIRAPAGRQRYNVLGALNAVTHELIMVTNDSYINSQSVCQLLRQIKALDLTVPVTLVMDNARYQRCRLVQELAEVLNIELLFLPAYSPNLNLIERLWKFVKKECLYSKYYETFADFSLAISQCLNQTHTTYKTQLDSLLALNFQTFNESSIVSG